MAAWEGREAVFTEAEGRISFAADPFGIDFQEQIDFFRQKRNAPSKVWTDFMYGQHDRAFVIAGVDDERMLIEFRSALDEHAIRMNDIAAFAQEFDRIVEKYGWAYNGGREWRIRTIFETNVRTSHMAGRLKQMRDPDVIASRPYWMYVHGETRVPMNPRPQHVAWDGMVLMHDDPWWDIYFPPNDWRCSCGVRTLSEGDLRRMGKDGPDKAPAIVQVMTSTGKDKPEVMYPEGVGYGWAYMPGDQWDRGLVPSALEDEAEKAVQRRRDAGLPLLELPPDGRNVVAIDEPGPIEDLLAKSKPLKSPLLPAHNTPDAWHPDDYIRAFLEPFGADIGKPVLWEDPTGTKVLISEGMFRDRNGGLKLFKQGREPYAAQLAEAIKDPDEIWLGIRRVGLYEAFPDSGAEDYHLTRQYIRADANTGLFTAFNLTRSHWEATTGIKPGKPGKMNWNYLQNQRVGKRLWQRK